MEVTPRMERLLDSVILIDHFNDIKKATNFILGLDPDKTAISVITRAEVLTGFEDNEARHAKALLDQFHLLLIEKETADKAAKLRKAHGWKLPDAFQAALCMEHHIKLTTRNTKDFNPNKYPFVEIPYRL
ncbi:MAG: PIN domain-containing protein [Deltaproteobacteria bacterium]|nr:PIN domain-containing protein [Deltaproteobacteria bacterium]MBW1943948.1 PIN domain-containing protein [Deltaproteobacteria bacterium]